MYTAVPNGAWASPTITLANMDAAMDNQGYAFNIYQVQWSIAAATNRDARTNGLTSAVSRPADTYTIRYCYYCHICNTAAKGSTSGNYASITA